MVRDEVDAGCAGLPVSLAPESRKRPGGRWPTQRDSRRTPPRLTGSRGVICELVGTEILNIIRIVCALLTQ